MSQIQGGGWLGDTKNVLHFKQNPPFFVYLELALTLFAPRASYISHSKFVTVL